MKKPKSCTIGGVQMTPERTKRFLRERTGKKILFSGKRLGSRAKIAYHFPMHMGGAAPTFKDVKNIEKAEGLREKYGIPVKYGWKPGEPAADYLARMEEEVKQLKKEEKKENKIIREAEKAKIKQGAAPSDIAVTSTGSEGITKLIIVIIVIGAIFAVLSSLFHFK